MLTGAFGQSLWTRLKRTRKNNLISSIHSLNGHLWSLFQARFIHFIEKNIILCIFNLMIYILLYVFSLMRRNLTDFRPAEGFNTVALPASPSYVFAVPEKK